MAWDRRSSGPDIRYPRAVPSNSSPVRQAPARRRCSASSSCRFKPTRGLIRMFDRNISSIPREEFPMLRRRVGIVFQDFRLLDHLTTYENVALPLRVPARGVELPVPTCSNSLNGSDSASASTCCRPCSPAARSSAPHRTGADRRHGDPACRRCRPATSIRLWRADCSISSWNSIGSGPRW